MKLNTLVLDPFVSLGYLVIIEVPKAVTSGTRRLARVGNGKSMAQYEGMDVAAASIERGCCPLCNLSLQEDGASDSGRRCAACGIVWRLAHGKVISSRDLNEDEIARAVEPRSFD